MDAPCTFHIRKVSPSVLGHLLCQSQYELVCLIVALAALQHWHMSSIDVKTAFLYGELDEELFMEQPEGFKKKGQEHKVFHLK